MNDFLFFSEESFQALKQRKGPETDSIRHYLALLTEKDDEDIFHPFCVACGIENKFHKQAWSYLAKEMKLLSLSVLWITEKNEKYTDKAKQIIKYLNTLPDWSDNCRKNQRTKNIYPETVSVIRGLVAALTVFGDCLGRDLKIQTQKKLSFFCERLYEIIYKKEEYFFNDLTDDRVSDLASGLGVCAVFLKDFDPRYKKWIDLSVRCVRYFLDHLPKDGSYINGLLRWEYIMFNIFIFANSLMANIGNREILDHPIWEKTKNFAINSSAPLCSNISQFDQSIHLSIYNPLNGILSKIFAYYFNDKYILWGLKTAKNKTYYHPLEIFFADTEISDNTHNDIKSVFYPDAGISFLRSGWTDSDSLITFKSEHKKHILSHKDQNNIEIFMGSEEMLIESGTCYSGHPNYENRYFGSHAHNVILIDSKGQLPKAQNKGGIIKYCSNNDFDYVCGDASSVYSKAKIYLRNLLYIKPDILILYDYVLLNSSGNIEWLWHTPGSVHVHSLSKKKTCLFSNKNKYMSLFVLEPETWSYRLTKDFVLDNWWNMHERVHNVLRIKSTYRKEVNFIGLFYLNNKEHENLPCEYTDNTIKLCIGNKNYSITAEKGMLFNNNKEIY